MIARLLSLAALTVFSISSFAAISAVEQIKPEQTTPDQTTVLMKQLVSCGEVQAAKHLALCIPMAIGAAFSKGMAESLAPYERAMATAKTCDDLNSAYKVLVDAAKNYGVTDPEEYFNSPEGKTALDQLIVELRKIK